MRLYVGNLSYDTNDEELERAFGQYGTVESATVIIDRESGRSKGFGFVEMPSDAEAQTAMREMDGAQLDGRSIKVNEARPPAERGRF